MQAMTVRLSERIQTARKQAGLTQKELADRVGISQTAIHKLECGRSRSSRRTVPIALACNVDPIWLETGKGEMGLSAAGVRLAVETMESIAEGDEQYYSGRNARAPLISWLDAGLPPDASHFKGPQVEQYVPVTRRVSRQVFALRVTGDSMDTEFSEGDVIIVDPAVPPEHKRFVVARLPGVAEATFKQLITDGGRKYLKPLNPRYPIVELESAAQICGVVVSKYKEY